MTWYWYFARRNEIFCDLDSPQAATLCLLRLRRALLQRKLSIQSIYLFHSVSPGKFHLVLTLRKPMNARWRALWALWFGSDRKRACYILARIERKIPRPDLLITPEKLAMPRQPDIFCTCPGKHKSRAITNHCPVLRHIQGIERGAVYFTKWHKNEKTKGRPPIRHEGKINVRRLLRWN